MESELIPYQAYKSKRHSRNGSNSLFISNIISPSVSRPQSIAASPANLVTPSSNHKPLHEQGDDVLFNGLSRQGSRSGSFDLTGHGMPLESRHGANGRAQSTQTPSPASSRNSSISFVATPPAPDNELTTPPLNGNADTPDSTFSTPLPGSSKPLPVVRKASKFRHVPMRTSKSPLPSSPLRPPVHSRSDSSSTPVLDQPTLPDPGPRSRVTSLSSVAFDTPTETPLPPVAPHEIGLSGRHSDNFRSTADDPLPQLADTTPPRSRPASVGPPKIKPSAPPTISATTSTASSVSQAPSNATPSTSSRPHAPYRPGFQPKGVYRPRTDEFAEHRKQVHDRDRIERTKLERRLEKLIDLHFPRDGVVMPPAVNRRASSFFDFNISDLKNGDARLWKGMQSTKVDIRAAEQRITPWQEDSAISKCPFCSASFLPLSNRKHHCRLCGRIICSLPVKHPQRPATCSLLFVVDSKTRQIEEVGEGVDYGVRKRRSVVPMQKGKEKEEVPSDDDKFLKGVRICRQCHPVLLQQQHQQEQHHIPALAKLYQAFILLEKEIEDSLPQFQEMIISLSHDGQPTKEASAARKRLLEAFSQYDALAKRIRSLPSVGGPGNSHERVQMAILTRSNLFLQKHMVPLQSLPRLSKPHTDSRKQQLGDTGNGSAALDPDSELAHALQPLLEQEALLVSYVEEAKAHRKFEDAKTLKANLVEIRAEIDRIFAEADTSNKVGQSRS